MCLMGGVKSRCTEPADQYGPNWVPLSRYRLPVSLLGLTTVSAWVWFIISLYNFNKVARPAKQIHRPFKPFNLFLNLNG